MSYFISRVPPIFKDWQYQSLSEGINQEDWIKTTKKFKNIKPLEEIGRHNLFSIQNSDFFLHFWQTEKYGNAIIFSGFPYRHKGEFIKYLYQICSELRANIYSLGDNGNTARTFDFSKYQDSIDKEYFPINEKKVTDIGVSEMIGLTCIPTKDISKVVSFLGLFEDEYTTWEEAVQMCFDSKCFFIRILEGWIVVIGKIENLTEKFENRINLRAPQDQQTFNLLKIISSEFGQVVYYFNASKYSYFEQFIAENGELTFKYIHGDGEEEIEGTKTIDYSPDFNDFCYDQSILEGIQLYK